jgi:hypothetical protein
MYLFFLILVVLQDLLDQQKRNDDGMIPHIFNQDLILRVVLILMVMVCDLAEKEPNI